MPRMERISVPDYFDAGCFGFVREVLEEKLGT